MPLYLSDVVALAHEESGYIGKKKKTDDLDVKEAPNGKGLYNKYARDVYEAGFFNGDKQGYDFCTSYAHWLMLKCCGSKEECEKHFPITSLGASTYWAWNWFNKNGKAGGEPKPGAFIFFSTNGTTAKGKMNHTGVVLDVKDGTVFTAEGNVENVVVEKSYKRGDIKIAAYGYVDYDEEPTTNVEDTNEKIAELTAKLSACEDKIAEQEEIINNQNVVISNIKALLKSLE